MGGLAEPGNVLTAEEVPQSLPSSGIKIILDIIYLSCEAIRCRQQEQWLWQQGYRSQLPIRCSCKHNLRTLELPIVQDESHQISFIADRLSLRAKHYGYICVSVCLSVWLTDWLTDWLTQWRTDRPTDWRMTGQFLYLPFHYSVCLSVVVLARKSTKVFTILILSRNVIRNARPWSLSLFGFCFINSWLALSRNKT